MENSSFIPYQRAFVANLTSSLVLGHQRKYNHSWTGTHSARMLVLVGCSISSSIQHGTHSGLVRIDQRTPGQASKWIQTRHSYAVSALHTSVTVSIIVKSQESEHRSLVDKVQSLYRSGAVSFPGFHTGTPYVPRRFKRSRRWQLVWRSQIDKILHAKHNTVAQMTAKGAHYKQSFLCELYVSRICSERLKRYRRLRKTCVQ